MPYTTESRRNWVCLSFRTRPAPYGGVRCRCVMGAVVTLQRGGFTAPPSVSSSSLWLFLTTNPPSQASPFPGPLKCPSWSFFRGYEVRDRVARFSSLQLSFRFLVTEAAVEAPLLPLPPPFRRTPEAAPAAARLSFWQLSQSVPSISKVFMTAEKRYAFYALVGFPGLAD